MIMVKPKEELKKNNTNDRTQNKQTNGTNTSVRKGGREMAKVKVRKQIIVAVMYNQTLNFFALH